jgi:hypothetical protein
MSAATSSSPAAATPAAAASVPAPIVLPSTLPSLLLHFLSLQSRRSQTYSTFHSGFKLFLAEREEWEQEEQEELERKRKESTQLVKQVQQAKSGVVESLVKHSSEESKSDPDQQQLKSLPTSSVDAQDLQTLKAIAAANDAQRKARPNPEQVFQKLCAETMQAFQAASLEVRAVIAKLQSLHSPDATAFAKQLGQLQQYEKQKLELTIHQQMLQNQQYVLAHPRAHGQLQEHAHHVHSVTDAQGRVRQHPKHAHAHDSHAHGAHGLEAVGEDEIDPEDAQEFADNAQPFTRHLSALLSDTAFQTDAPHFLFPPSGRAPEKVDTALPGTSTPPSSTLAPAISEAQITAYLEEMASLREQEIQVVQGINGILEEVRMETMEEVEEDDDA